VAFLKANGNHEAAERIKQRVNNDLMMIRDVGYCSGMENYSRHLAGRAAGVPPEVSPGFDSPDRRFAGSPIRRFASSLISLVLPIRQP